MDLISLKGHAFLKLPELNTNDTGLVKLVLYRMLNKGHLFLEERNKFPRFKELLHNV